MARAVISPKLRIVIPKEIRERLNLQPGQVVSLIARGDMVTLVPQRPIADLRGIARGASVPPCGPSARWSTRVSSRSTPTWRSRRPT